MIIERKKNKSAQTNLMSSILLLVLNSHRLLFGGDAGLDVWLECLNEFDRNHQENYFGPCIANFVKASHHGSRNSSSVELWRRILDTKATIGISAGKTYGHPHQQTISDILTAAQQAGSAVQILSTNTCTECLANQTIPPENLNSLVYESPPFPIEVGEALRRVRSSAIPLNAPKPVLGSYIFRFAVEDDTVTVTRGLVPRASRNVKCIYENTRAQDFPLCSQ